MGTQFAFAIILAAGVIPLFSTSSAHAQSFTVGSVQTVMTAAQRSKAGLSMWPDSTLGVSLINGTNYLFAANSWPNGTLGFTTSDLNNLGLAPGRAASSRKRNGRRKIAHGKAGAFDHDYAGGGTVYYDAGTGILIHMYHGEYWYRPETGRFFYAGLGLAFSTNLGKTWHRLGQVINPQTVRTGECTIDVGAGTLVPVGGFFYAYYTDMGMGCTNLGPAVARASISSVIAAAQAGTPFTSGDGNLFQKYHNGSFSQPGVTDLANPQNGGGAFSSLWTSESDDWPTFLNVRYDSYLRQYIAAYVGGWKSGKSGLYLRISKDGINWGAPTEVVHDNAAFYPTLLNTSGGDPNVLGSQFYLHYVTPFPNFSSNMNLDRVPITVSGGTTALPPPTPVHN
jgi:hypothetical protein